MKKLTRYSAFILAIVLIQYCKIQPKEEVEKIVDFSALETLFEEWRAFEKPPLHNGAPDYRDETFNVRRPEFKAIRAKLKLFDRSDWTTEQQIDWTIIWAEMNGFQFNTRVLKPWERDPAFYKVLWMHRSDVPAHEGPTNHGICDLWTYSFPLSDQEKERLINELKIISPFYDQARVNLIGNAKDLWITGIRDIQAQKTDLTKIKSLEGVGQDPTLVATIDESILATDEFIKWLTDESVHKTGSSGIGKRSYTWNLKNVHLIPMDWDDEVMLLKRELARAWSALKLEEHRNRNLPPLTAANTPEEFKKLTEKAAKSLMEFLDKNEIVTVKDYFEPALTAQLGDFQPENERNFFTIGLHYDPRPLYSHFYHWFELARMDIEPHQRKIRRDPLLYNIFDSRNEGTATAVEEMFMQAGLYDDNPRVKEIVYIMIAQRAARGLGSLYAHANDMTMEEAGAIHSEYTPRGWMKTEKELLIFEQHLYLRQPGYGTSYITGKYLLESALAAYAKSEEAENRPFKLKAFFDKLNGIGNIPISLSRWQMTGSSDHLNDILP